MSTHHYEEDFYAWTQKQAALLKARRLDNIDTDHLIEELEAMGARERRELTNRLAVLLVHLLKWRYQPERRGNSGRLTIEVQRMDVAGLLEDIPSLKSVVDACFEKAYKKAVLLAARETGFSKSTFPPAVPFTLTDALAADFWPQ